MNRPVPSKADPAPWGSPRRPLCIACLPLLYSLAQAAFAESHHEAGGTTEFSVIEASFEAMQSAMASGHSSATAIVSQYLARIADYDDDLHAALAVNDRALALAGKRDRERATGRVRGPLHGIPIALKDVIHTVEMPTTGGALAFRGHVPPYDATLTKRLVDAGAIIIAKTTLTELANYVAPGMPNGYSALGGYSYNPYDPSVDTDAPDDRGLLDTGGSSSGIGTAANLWAANIGTETSGSIMSPSSMMWLVGIKPTVGRISRHGVIPITRDQDTPGPMAKTVADAATLLAVMAGPDPEDPATDRCQPLPADEYWRTTGPAPLQGLRIGIPEAYYLEPIVPPGEQEAMGGASSAERKLMSRAQGVIRSLGAQVLAPTDIPSIVAPNPEDNFLNFGVCSAADQGIGSDDGCSTVLKYGMKRDFDRWLNSLGHAAPVASLRELVAFNEAHAAEGAIRYGQARLLLSDEIDLQRDEERYRRDRLRDLRLSREQGLDAAFDAADADVLLFPHKTAASLVNKAGYPAITVPYGRLTLTADSPDRKAYWRPWAVTFVAPPCEEPLLLRVAHAFEGATRSRRAPNLFP